MGGRRTTKQELEQIEALTKEGLTTKEIAARLNRSEAAIRNLRYKKRLVSRIKDETMDLLAQRERLIEEVKALKTRKISLTSDLVNLKKAREKLKGVIKTESYFLEQILSKALINLKLKRPDLFTLTAEDQIGLILKALLK